MTFSSWVRSLHLVWRKSTTIRGCDRRYLTIIMPQNSASCDYCRWPSGWLFLDRITIMYKPMYDRHTAEPWFTQILKSGQTNTKGRYAKQTLQAIARLPNGTYPKYTDVFLPWTVKTKRPKNLLFKKKMVSRYQRAIPRCPFGPQHVDEAVI